MGWASAKSGMQAAQLRTFGEDVTYEPDGGGTLAVRSIFRSSHTALDLETDAAVVSNQPVFHVRRGSVVGFDLTVDPTEQLDRIVRNGVCWTVVEIMDDGEGMLTLRCQKTTAD